MSNAPLRTAVIGFGQIAARYADDPLMAKYYPYATHAQVLFNNPQFEWLAVVDPDENSRSEASTHWEVPYVAEDISHLGRLASDIDVAVIATPPQFRLDIIEKLPNLKAVLVEKPLGCTLDEANLFLEYCEKRNILVQVNFWRRADQLFRALATNELKERVGTIQAVHAVYGNGLLNNGSHLVDFIRMLLGEVSFVAPLGEHSFIEGPIKHDMNLGFLLGLESGVSVVAQPIQFSCYREVGIEIWGEKGHLSILNEGLTVTYRQSTQNRAMSETNEISFDDADYLESTVGDALFHMYENLALALKGNKTLCSPGASALKTSQIVSLIQYSFCEKKPIYLSESIKESFTE